MSKGNPIIKLRVTPELLDRIRKAIDQNNERRGDQPYDLSGWLRQAVEERLDKLERARKSGRRKSATVSPAVSDGAQLQEGVSHSEIHGENFDKDVAN